MVPTEVPSREQNIRYLQTKRDRMNHTLDLLDVTPDPYPERQPRMSGHGAPSTDLTHLNGKAAALRLAIVAASWHTEIMDGLLAGALRAAKDAGIAEPTVLRVPGSFELPVAAARLAPRL